jgi:hypothetical protein
MNNDSSTFCLTDIEIKQPQYVTEMTSDHIVLDNTTQKPVEKNIKITHNNYRGINHQVFQ